MQISLSNLSKVGYQPFLGILAGSCSVLAFFFLAISTTFLDVFFMLTGFMVLLSGFGSKPFSIFRSPVAYAFLSFYAVICLSALYSSAPWHEVFQYLLKFSKFGWALFLMPVFSSQRWASYALWGFLASIAVTLVLSYLRFFVWHFPANPAWGLASVFKGHIDQGFLFSIAMIILFELARDRQGYGRYICQTLAILIFINVLFMSEGRTGYVIALLLFIYWLSSAYQWKGFLMALLICIGALGTSYLSSSVFYNRVHQVVDESQGYGRGEQETSVGTRLEMQTRALALIRERPWLGYGTGAMPSAYRHYVASYPQESSRVFDDANNIFLNIAVQYGVLGLLLYGFFLRYLWVNSKGLPVFERRIFQALLLTILVGGLANSWLKDSVESHFFVLMSVWCFSAPYRYQAPIPTRT